MKCSDNSRYIIHQTRLQVCQTIYSMDPMELKKENKRSNSILSQAVTQMYLVKKVFLKI